MNRLLSSLVVCCALVAASSAAQGQIVTQLNAGGSRLNDLAEPAGGWAFYTFQSGSNAPNIAGPIGIGLARAYSITDDPTTLAALSSAGTFLENNPNFHTWDGLLAQALDQAGIAPSPSTGFGSYTAMMLNRYATLDQQAFKDALIDYRVNQQFLPNLTAWDFGIAIASARAVGAGAAEEQFWIDATEEALDNLRVGYYDNMSMAGAAYGLASVGANYTSGDLNSFAYNLDVAGMAAALAAAQLADGSMHDSYMLPSEPGFVQDSSYLILALNEINPTLYRGNMDNAQAYILGQQLPLGGWMNAGDPLGENNEVTGEALWGIVTAVPEPSTWAMLALAGVVGGVIYRRRRSK